MPSSRYIQRKIHIQYSFIYINLCVKSKNQTTFIDISNNYLGGNQVFMLTANNEIREKKYCLDATIPGMPVKMLDCHGEGGNQKWTYDEDVSDCFSHACTCANKIKREKLI